MTWLGWTLLVMFVVSLPVNVLQFIAGSRAAKVGVSIAIVLNLLVLFGILFVGTGPLL